MTLQLSHPGLIEIGGRGGASASTLRLAAGGFQRGFFGGELVATLALAQDNAFGQPLESQLRSCLLAGWLCDEAGFDPELSATTYWVSLLRYVGCTGHTHEVASVFGERSPG